MDVSLDSIALPAWEPEKAAEWDEAFEKVENYLRACRVSSRLHRARLAGAILQRALIKQATTSDALSSLAIDETRAMVAQWMSELLQRPDLGRQASMDEGYLALYLCDAPMRWPNAFLNPRETPPGFSETLHARLVKTGPELEISSMVPRPLDRGLIPGLAGSAMETLERFPFIKTLLMWIGFAALLVFLFLRTRQ